MDPELEKLLATIPAGTPPDQVAAFLRAHGYGPPGAAATDAARVAPPEEQAAARRNSGVLPMAFTIGGGIAGAGAGPMGAIGGAALGGAAGGAVQEMIDRLAGRPTAPMTLTGQAGRLARDAGQGAIMEMLGPVLGKTAGGAARAGARTLGRIADAQTSRVPLTAGQTLDSPVLKTLENATAVIPTGRGTMGRFGQRQAEAAGARAEEIATQMAGGSVPTREEAGVLAQRAAQRIGQEFEQRRFPLMERFKTLVDDAFPTASTAAVPTNAELLKVNPNDPALRASLRAHTQAGGDLQSWAALPSAPPTATGVPLNGVRALVAKWEEQAAKKSLAKDLKPVLEDAKALLADADAGVLNAGDLLARRTKLGQQANFSSPLVPPNPAKTELKQLWGAVSDDLKAAAKAVGPEAEAVLKQHDQMVRGFRESSRINNPAGADFWAAVETAATPEQAFNLVTRHPNNAAALRAIREKMTAEEFQPIAARHFLDLGKANPSVQNAAGDVFSPETFLSRWNARGMTPEVQRELFGSGVALSDDMQKFLKTAEEIKSSGAYRNPSGTAGMLQGTQLLRDIGNVLQFGSMGGAAATGNMGALAASAGVPVVAAQGFTSPLTAKAIEAGARGTRATGQTLESVMQALFPLRRP